jgi:hypothetical protein
LRIFIAAQSDGDTGFLEILFRSGLNGEDWLELRSGSIGRGGGLGSWRIFDRIIGVVARMGTQSLFVAKSSYIVCEELIVPNWGAGWGAIRFGAIRLRQSGEETCKAGRSRGSCRGLVLHFLENTPGGRAIR